ncbi:hypothetical protein BDV96DRAFT_336748 [Lophiotrema nucula]|uniref:Uncharacterized protein n=1 Tax=Lophiotrema nucula TaxID=690887 RepID=A0A6A5YJD4_9PLEO|nr:hypothetical protein BDV96DRAFT_336748 [Lophiotrema nucula]
MERLTSPTPPLPLRFPGRQINGHFDAPPLPPLPESFSKLELVPPPLFSKRTRRQPNAKPTNIEIPPLPPPVQSALPFSPASTRSTRSSNSRTFSSPASSAPSSPGSRTTFSHPSSPMPIYWAEIRFDPVPRHKLKRKLSPKNETLRALRAKDSEACLQKKYEEQTCAYLNGMLFGSVQRRPGLRMIEED